MNDKNLIPNSQNSILDDEKLTRMTRSWIREAIRNEYNLSTVLIALNTLWQDVVVEEYSQWRPTEDEKAFFGKVEQFFSDYGQGFVRRVSWYDHGMSWKDRESIERDVANEHFSNRILEKIKLFTKIAYCTLSREGKITTEGMLKYKIMVTDSEKNIFSYLYATSRALDDLIIVGDSKPIYIMPPKEPLMNNNKRAYRINRYVGYCKFLEDYASDREDLFEPATQLIWIISTYY